MFASRSVLVVLALLGLAACDSADPAAPLGAFPPEAVSPEAVSPEATTVNAPTPASLTSAEYDSWVPLASFDLVVDEDFDAYYLVTDDGVESDHAVLFLNRSEEVVLEYRFSGRASVAPGGKGGGPTGDATTTLFDVEARWPLIDRSVGRLILHNEGEAVWDGFMDAGDVGNWASLGTSTFAGRSIHRKRNRLRIDNEPMQIGEHGTCVPAEKTYVTCTDFELRFGTTSVPEITTVNVIGPASATLSLTAPGQ